MRHATVSSSRCKRNNELRSFSNRNLSHFVQPSSIHTTPHHTTTTEAAAVFVGIKFSFFNFFSLNISQHPPLCYTRHSTNLFSRSRSRLPLLARRASPSAQPPSPRGRQLPCRRRRQRRRRRRRHPPAPRASPSAQPPSCPAPRSHRKAYEDYLKRLSQQRRGTASPAAGK